MKFGPVLAAFALASCVAGEAQERAFPVSKPIRTEEAVPFSSLRLEKDASISVRHYSIGGADLPAEGTNITLTCWINREAGRLSICLPPDNSPLLYVGDVAAADWRIRQMTFDTSALPPPKADVTVTNITVHLSPKDRLVLTPPAKVRPEADVKWARQPDTQAIQRALWPSWRSRAGVGRTEARMRCQVQTDLSVICADIRANPEAFDSTKFGMTLDTRLATEYTSSPLLADGSRAAGAWIEIVVVSDEPPLTVAPPPPRQ